MALEMKRSCKKCACDLEPDAQAYICSYECTYCPDCARAVGHVCPDCGGELVSRPKRRQDA